MIDKTRTELGLTERGEFGTFPGERCAAKEPLDSMSEAFWAQVVEGEFDEEGVTGDNGWIFRYGRWTYENEGPYHELIGHESEADAIAHFLAMAGQKGTSK